MTSYGGRYATRRSLFLQFWESTIVWRTRTGTNETYPLIRVTNFRLHPTYARYVTWSKLVVQCVLPVAILVFFNRSVASVAPEYVEIVGFYTASVLTLGQKTGYFVIFSFLVSTYSGVALSLPRVGSAGWG